MKHKLIVAISLLVIIGTVVLSLVKYEHYRNWQDVQSAKARATAYIQAQTKASQVADQEAKINKLKAQCSKDHQLFVQTNGKSANGDCDPTLQLVQ